ncbi:hypothetical protein [Ideonella sp. YS5]|uniref:hypothetical protein n=1 Tax=Ideonella sp. YS5 TaxID=3453714 RepID=UPI003EEB00BF
MRTYRNIIMLVAWVLLWFSLLLSGMSFDSAPIDLVRQTLEATGLWSDCKGYDDPLYCSSPKVLSLLVFCGILGALSYPAFDSPRPMRWVTGVASTIFAGYVAMSPARFEQPYTVFVLVFQFICMVAGGYGASRLLAWCIRREKA